MSVLACVRNLIEAALHYPTAQRFPAASSALASSTIDQYSIPTSERSCADSRSRVDDLFAGVDFYFIGDIDYGSTDPDEVVEIVRRLTIVARRFNLWVVTDFGGRAGPERQPGLVELAVGAAFQAYADFDPHPDPFDKAAMLLRGITQGHPFDDGNKRTGFLVAAYYLSKRDFGYSAFVDADAVVEFCLDISAGRVREINTIGDRLRRFWGQ